LFLKIHFRNLAIKHFKINIDIKNKSRFSMLMKFQKTVN
jgi:hypothetical protein